MDTADDAQDAMGYADSIAWLGRAPPAAASASPSSPHAAA
jgi:hypothetical protein